MLTTQRFVSLLAASLFALSLSGCSGPPEDASIAWECDRGLKAAYAELDYAKAKGFGGTVDWTRAASLLSAARIQEEFGKYPNCINKVKRARYYIRRSKS